MGAWIIKILEWKELSPPGRNECAQERLGRSDWFHDQIEHLRQKESTAFATSYLLAIGTSHSFVISQVRETVRGSIS